MCSECIQDVDILVGVIILRPECAHKTSSSSTYQCFVRRQHPQTSDFVLMMCSDCGCRRCGEHPLFQLFSGCVQIVDVIGVAKIPFSNCSLDVFRLWMFQMSLCHKFPFVWTCSLSF